MQDIEDCLCTEADHDTPVEAIFQEKAKIEEEIESLLKMLEDRTGIRITDLAVDHTHVIEDGPKIDVSVFIDLP